VNSAVETRRSKPAKRFCLKVLECSCCLGRNCDGRVLFVGSAPLSFITEPAAHKRPTNAPPVGQQTVIRAPPPHTLPEQRDSTRATRIGKAIRSGRSESTKRFGPGGPNRGSDSKRPVRIGNAIRAGRPESAKRFESGTPRVEPGGANRQSDSNRPVRIDKSIRTGRSESTKCFEPAGPNRQIDSNRPVRIDKAIRTGRPESTQRFALAARVDKTIRAADPNQRSDKSRPARIDKAIRVGRTESLHRFESETKNISNMFSFRSADLSFFLVRVGRPELKNNSAGKRSKSAQVDKMILDRRELKIDSSRWAPIATQISTLIWAKTGGGRIHFV